jgi:hypothetical protein
MTKKRGSVSISALSPRERAATRHSTDIDTLHPLHAIRQQVPAARNATAQPTRVSTRSW